METTIGTLGFHWANGKENGNYRYSRVYIGYNGKENGKYRDYRDYIRGILGLCYPKNGESNGKEHGT